MLKTFFSKNKCLLINNRQVHYVRSSLFIPSNAKVSADKINQTTETSNQNKSSSVSCIIMENNGFLSDTGSGFITYLPAGKRVINKLTNLIREEMDKINAQETEMPALCDLNLWDLTGRNELMGSELFRLEDRRNKKLCLCPTNEETITNLVSKYSKLLSSNCFKDSLRLYQITRKYRDESRPKHGLLRSREFLMKDLYTFHINSVCAEKTYDNVCKAYEIIFDRLNLKYHKALASVGAMGGRMSHEYHVESNVGEDKIYTCSTCNKAVSVDLIKSEKEQIKQKDVCISLNCNIETQSEQVSFKKSIEIGHTFILGDRYTKHFPIFLKNSNEAVIMGCYGLGVSRIIQACIESQHIKGQFPNFPPEIAPYQICIIPAKKGSKEEEKSESLVKYLVNMLDKSGLYKDDILVDDRDWLSIGSRVIDAKLLGIPYVIVLGKSIHDEQIEINFTSKFLSDSLNKDKVLCHSRETAVVMKQLNSDYLYAKKQSKLSKYFSER